jgi:hypothetical protein
VKKELPRIPRRMSFAAGESRHTLGRDDALDLLHWLGLDRPEFGAVRRSELAALCRRRLWPMPRNVDPAVPNRRAAGALRAAAAEMLAFVERAKDSHVTFG